MNTTSITVRPKKTYICSSLLYVEILQYWKNDDIAPIIIAPAIPSAKPYIQEYNILSAVALDRIAYIEKASVTAIPHDAITNPLRLTQSKQYIFSVCSI